MIKILAAIGLGSALMLAPVLALADEAAPAAGAPAATTEKPAMKAPMKKKHHVVKKKKKTTKPAPAKPAAPAEAPKT